MSSVICQSTSLNYFVIMYNFWRHNCHYCVSLWLPILYLIIVFVNFDWEKALNKIFSIKSYWIRSCLKSTQRKKNQRPYVMNMRAWLNKITCSGHKNWMKWRKYFNTTNKIAQIGKYLLHKTLGGDPANGEPPFTSEARG